MRSIDIQLDQEALRPGEELTGRVAWDLVAETSPMLWISVLWHTEGKGTEDNKTVEQVEIRGPDVSGTQAFSFRLPAFPWSFSGELISVMWQVEASLEGVDLVAQRGFVMAPQGQEILLHAVADD